MTEIWIHLDPSDCSPERTRRNLGLIIKALKWSKLSLDSLRPPGISIVTNLLLQCNLLRNRCRFQLARFRPNSIDAHFLNDRQLPDLYAFNCPEGFSPEAYQDLLERFMQACDLLLTDVKQGFLKIEACELAMAILVWKELNAMELLGRMAR